MRSSFIHRWAVLVMLAGGTLTQSMCASGSGYFCECPATDPANPGTLPCTCLQQQSTGIGAILGGIGASIANEYIRSVVSDWLQIGTGLSFGLST